MLYYKESTLKNVGFLSYLRNANIEAVIINVDPSLINSYVTGMNMIPTSNLSHLHADLLFLKASNGTSTHTGCIFDFLTKDEINSILSEKDEVLRGQLNAIKSLPLYLLGHVGNNRDSMLDCQVSNEPILNAIGKTWVHVATKPNIMSMLIEITNTTPTDMKYYSCFDEFAFNGKTLFGALGAMQDHALSLLFNNIPFVMNDGHTTIPRQDQ